MPRAYVVGAAGRPREWPRPEPTTGRRGSLEELVDRRFGFVQQLVRGGCLFVRALAWDVAGARGVAVGGLVAVVLCEARLGLVDEPHCRSPSGGEHVELSRGPGDYELSVGSEYVRGRRLPRGVEGERFSERRRRARRSEPRG